MSEETFQARALYEFVGQDETELNFQPDEILTITSTNAGEGWWYATNGSGKAGAVPAAYLEKFVPTVEELINEIPLKPPVDRPEPTPAWVPPVHQPEPALETHTEQVPPASVETSESFDPYISVVDQITSTPLDDDFPTMDLGQPATTTDMPYPSDPFPNPSNLFDFPSNGFQFNTNPPPAPEANNGFFDDGYTTPTHYQQQMNPSSLIDTTYEPRSSDYSVPSTNYPSFEPPPFTPTPPPAAPAPTPAPVTTPTENPAALASPKPASLEKRKSLFGTLRGKKPGRENTENVRKAGAEAPTPTPPNPVESDEFSESGDHQVNSPPPGSNAENKTAAAAKARFFDKHGLDNYILSGSKLKFEDHAEIGYNESQGGVYWVASSTLPPFTCKVDEPHKGTKLAGFKAFMEYGIHTTFAGNRVVNRRYKHFDWLYEQLMLKYRFICIPQLPGKQIAGRFEQEFVEERRRQLELWLNRICHHPVLCASFPVQHFVKCELTDKDNKEWKSGKRKVEKEESRDALWLHCVHLIPSPPNELQIMTSIEAFAQQQPALETHLKNLSQGLSKFLERHTEVYEKDMQKIGELFAKLHTAVEIDGTTAGNKELAASIAKISASYNAIAQLYKTKASDGIRFFNEHLQEHIGLLSCFPAILQIHRSASEFIRTVQQRGPAATPDYNGAILRNQILNHVVLAEINLFQKDKVRDLNSYMKTVLSEQIQFYEKVTDELREALSTFH